MSRLTTVLVALAIAVSVPSALFAHCGQCGGAADNTQSEFQQLERDVPGLYLLNALYLTQEQAKDIHKLMQESLAAHTKAEAKYEKLMTQLEPRLQHLEKNLIALGARQRRNTPQKVYAAFKSGTVQRARQLQNETRRDLCKQSNELAAEAYDILKPGQRNIIDNFVPCFHPES